MTSIDVIVPTFNNLPELRACLASLDQGELGVVRALVCVDGSTDGTQAALTSSSFPFEIVVLEHPDGNNHGRAATRNLALPHVRAPFLLLLDSDMQLEAGSLAGHLALLEQARCVSVGPVRYSNSGANLWARYLTTRGIHKSRSGDEVRPLDFTTANSALRSEDLLATGGFDEEMSGYGGEDTELALRLVKTGLPFVYNATAPASSIESKTVDQALTELRWYGATNLRATRARHPRAPAPYWVDRLESTRLGDRAFRVALNPLTDKLVDLGLRIPVFGLQRRLLNYKVLRAVWTGYQAGAT